MEHEVNSDTICILCAWIDLQTLRKKAGRVRNHRTSRDHLYFQIGQNTEKIL